MKLATTLLFSSAIAVAIALGGCTTLPPAMAGGFQSSANAYSVGQAQAVQNVRLGTVLAVRSVTISTSGAMKAGGSVVGAALGGLAGHQIGGGNGKKVATVAGAILGAIGGNKVAASTYRQPGLAIAVKLDSGRAIEVTQAADVAISAGQRVQVVGNGYGSDPVRVLPFGEALR